MLKSKRDSCYFALADDRIFHEKPEIYVFHVKSADFFIPTINNPSKHHLQAM